MAKVSKRDFLKLLGGGSTAGALVAYSGPVNRLKLPTIEDPAVLPIESLKPEETKHSVDPDFFKHDWYEAVDANLWDTVRFRAGDILPNEFGMFVTGMYQRCPYSGLVKDSTHTNLQCPSRLPMPEAFWIQRGSFGVFGPQTPHIKEVLDRYAWRLLIGCKYYAQGALKSDLNKGFGFEHTRGLWIPQGMSFHMSFSADRERTVQIREPLEFAVEWKGVMVRGIS